MLASGGAASSRSRTCYISPKLTRYILSAAASRRCTFVVGYIALVPWFSTNTKHLKATFNRLLLKQAGERSEWEYPFAVAGINVSFMLIQMLDLHSGVLSNTDSKYAHFSRKCPNKLTSFSSLELPVEKSVLAIRNLQKNKYNVHTLG